MYATIPIVDIDIWYCRYRQFELLISAINCWYQQFQLLISAINYWYRQIIADISNSNCRYRQMVLNDDSAFHKWIGYRGKYYINSVTCSIRVLPIISSSVIFSCPNTIVIPKHSHSFFNVDLPSCGFFCFINPFQIFL